MTFPQQLCTLRPRSWTAARPVLLLALLAGAAEISAQEWRNDYLSERFSGDEGLSDATVFSVVEDNDGFLWFATADGLNRFNGNEFTVFRHDEAVPGTISANGVGSILVDSRGGLWVGTWGGGLNRLDPGAARFEVVPLPGHGQVLGTDRIQQLFEDSAGKVWIGTAGAGLYCLEPDTGRIRTYRTDSGLSHDRVWSMAEGAGFLWIGTSDGLNRWDPKSDQFVAFRPPDSGAEPLQARQLLFNNDSVWVGTRAGLLQFDPASQSFQPLLTDSRTPPEAAAFVNAFLYDSEHAVVWVATSLGLWAFDPVQRRAVELPGSGAMSAFQGLRVRDAHLDRSGLLWLATRGSGVLKVNLEPGRFRQLAEGLNIQAVAESGGDALWIGSLRGLFQVDLDGEAQAQPLPGFSASVWALAAQGPGLWVGSDRGLTLIGPEQRRHVFPGAGRVAERVFSVLPTESGVWFGAASGLFHLASSDSPPRPVPLPGFEQARQTGARITALLSDRADGLWVGTAHAGIYYVAGATTQAVQRFGYSRSQVEATLKIINDLAQVDDESLWIATDDGLYRLEVATGSLSHLGEDAGMADQTVKALSADGFGRLWLGTQLGLTIFEPSESRFVNLARRDGLSAAGFNPAARSIGDGGRLFFGGPNGVTIFRPEDVSPEEQDRPVAIDEITVNYEAVRPEPAANGILKLTLWPDDRTVSFGYALMDFRAPELHQYAYRLVGFDPDWVQAGSRRAAFYTNLAPGDYRFEVRASSGRGTWNTKPATVHVTVLPPLWATWWFRAFAGVFAIALPIGWHRLRLRHIHARKEELESQVGDRTRNLLQRSLKITEQRNQIAEQKIEIEGQRDELVKHAKLKEDVERIARHDIRTPLTSIVSLAQLMGEHPELDSDQRQSLKIIEQSGFRVLRLVGLSLDLFKMEQGTYDLKPARVDILAVVQKVRADLRGLIEATAVRVDIEVPEEDAGPFVRGDELLCYSLIGNLAKNAIEASPPGSTVGVVLVAGDTVEIQIRNRGAVPEELRESFFDKYSTSGKERGTGLGTYSARLMTEAQGGTVALATADGKTTVTVHLEAADPAVEPSDTRSPSPSRAFVVPQVANWPEMAVLIVDDDEHNRLVLGKYLQHPKIELDFASHGAAAVERFGARRFDCVFMDVEMPIMDGIKAVERMRALESDSKRPRCTIIALSSHDDEQVRLQALGAGYDRYLEKPARKSSILRLLWNRTLEPPIGQPAEDAIAATADSGVLVLDADLEDLIPSFLERKRGEVDELRGQAEARDAEQVRRVSHRLKGSFGMYGFEQAAQLCRRIEVAAEDAKLDEVPLHLGALAAHLDSISIKFEARD